MTRRPSPELGHLGGCRRHEGGTLACEDTGWGSTCQCDEDTDISEGHVTCVASGYLYQPCRMKGISPEPELYKCNTIPILVNIAKIVHTTWISFICNVCKLFRVVQVLWDGMYYGTTVECAFLKKMRNFSAHIFHKCAVDSVP